MKPGDIYKITVESDSQNPDTKKLPVVVLNGGHYRYLKLSIVAPITEWKENLDKNPFFVPLEPDGITGLNTKSIIDCFQLRALNHDKFMEKLGTLPKDKLKELKKSVSLILDIEPEDCE